MSIESYLFQTLGYLYGPLLTNTTVWLLIFPLCVLEALRMDSDHSEVYLCSYSITAKSAGIVPPIVQWLACIAPFPIHHSVISSRTSESDSLPNCTYYEITGCAMCQNTELSEILGFRTLSIVLSLSHGHRRGKLSHHNTGLLLPI
jgi:hypothetical protein